MVKTIKYDWLKIRNNFTDEYILDNDKNYISWEEEIPEGWNIAFGEVMIDELNDILVKYNFTDSYRIIQIKEKFGGLRWYDNGIPEEAVNDYNIWLDKYEELSYNTCIRCGEPATHMTNGWIEPLCNECDKR